MFLDSLNIFIDIAKKKPKKTIVVAAAEDEPVLEAVSVAKQAGIIDAILVGNIEKIREISAKINFDLTSVELVSENNPAISCRTAVDIVRQQRAQILMKGLVGTADCLRAVLDKEKGLRQGSLLSHISFFELERYHKLIALTDVAQNIAPDFDDKINILKNSVDLYHRLGLENPKIAIVAAVETVSLKMPVTIEAAAFTMMNRRKQITGCIIDGPLAFDNVVSKEAAAHKGIVSDVAGDADLILVPNIEVGNCLYKSFTNFAGATVAAIILGAAVPIVLTSRADSERSKLMSLALAASY
jgi:phosphate butyryltransferase